MHVIPWTLIVCHQAWRNNNAANCPEIATGYVKSLETAFMLTSTHVDTSGPHPKKTYTWATWTGMCFEWLQLSCTSDLCRCTVRLVCLWSQRTSDVANALQSEAEEKNFSEEERDITTVSDWLSAYWRFCTYASIQSPSHLYWKKPFGSDCGSSHSHSPTNTSVLADLFWRQLPRATCGNTLPCSNLPTYYTCSHLCT